MTSGSIMHILRTENTLVKLSVGEKTAFVKHEGGYLLVEAETDKIIT